LEAPLTDLQKFTDAALVKPEVVAAEPRAEVAPVVVPHVAVRDAEAQPAAVLRVAQVPPVAVL
jgi:hypothetical protein